MQARRIARVAGLLAAALLMVALASPPAGSFGLRRPGGASHAFTTSSVAAQAFAYLDAFYVEPKRIVPAPLLESAFRAVEGRYPEVIVDMAKDASSVTVRASGFAKTFDISDTGDPADTARAIDDVTAFVGERLDLDADEREQLLYLAVNGAFRALDPHTNIFSTKHFKDFKVSTSGSFGGIGFTFNVQDGEVVIISPIPDTPAARAGLRSRDRILYIDGTPTTNMSSNTAVGMMRGEPGTKVTLTIGRDGWGEPRDFTITREIIKIVSVESRRLEGDGEAPVVYARIKNFQSETSRELAAAIARLEQAGPAAGVVLDLRDNPGGLLEEAVKVADGFLDEGTIVSTRNRQGRQRVEEADKIDHPFTRLPLVVLINRGSASASEIVSAALADKRALLVGERTFGKGSVQQAFPLSDGGGVLVTVAQYLTPGDVSIQSIGIEPDLDLEAVLLTPERALLAPITSHRSERDLDNAFNEWGNARREAVASIRFLRTEDAVHGMALRQAKEKEEEEPPRELTDAEKGAKLAAEFEVRLARRILGAAKGRADAATRAGLIEASRAVVAKAQQEEDGRIVAAFAERGVDWAAGAADGDGAPKLTAVLPAGQELRAGEKARITVTARNEGKTTLHRVWGRTESSNPLLENLDFPFGTLAPGATRSWTAELDVPAGVEERWDTVTLAMHAGQAKPAAAAATAAAGRGSVRTVARDVPQYAYRYELADENPEKPALSGDGRLEEGERARLSVTLTNRGGVESPAVEANLFADEKEQLYMEEVRSKLEKLAPGASLGAKLSFKVLRALEDGSVKINLTFNDRGAGGFLSDSFEVPTRTAYERTGSRVPPLISVGDAPPLQTESDAVTFTVKASDDGSVRDLVVYRGEKKIAYERNAAGGASFETAVTVPLEPGSNRVLVVARDDKEIPAQKVLWIYRRGGESELAAAPREGDGTAGP